MEDRTKYYTTCRYLFIRYAKIQKAVPERTALIYTYYTKLFLGEEFLDLVLVNDSLFESIGAAFRAAYGTNHLSPVFRF